jgi:C1A family cysteine protease
VLGIDKLPVVFGFSVYESFESDEVAKTGTVLMPDKSEQLLGGHAVVLCGYDDETKRFLVRNSWGEEWGQAGYFTLPYEYVTDPNLASDFWVVQTVKG